MRKSGKVVRIIVLDSCFFYINICRTTLTHPYHEKKYYAFVVFTLLGLTMQAQFSNLYPIPSYNVPIESGYARFQENVHAINTDAPLGKRDAHVIITSRGPETSGCQAQVWLYSLDGLDILGPYTILCGETLTVEIDEREWGVLVQTEYDVLVDVWIE